MRDSYCFLIIGIGLLLSGCARLSVSVEVLNSAYWASPEYIDSVTLTKIVAAEKSIRDGHFAKGRDDQKDFAKKVLVILSEIPPPDKLSPRFVEPIVIDSLLISFNSNIDNIFREAGEYYNAAFDEVSNAGKVTLNAKLNYANGSKTLANFANNLQYSYTKLIQEKGINMDPVKKKELVEIIDNAFKGVQEAAAVQSNSKSGFEKIEKIVRQAAMDSNSGFIKGSGILNDLRASAVVYAPCDYWKGRFNKTVCYGQFGNTDCAVKMESVGDFTLKGVRLDASKITQATFSVTKEAIQIVAAVYGVPRLKGQQVAVAPGWQTSNSQEADEPTSPGKRLLDAETAIRQLRLARLAMFESIVTQRQSIEDDAKREQAIKTIKQTLEVNSRELYPADEVLRE